MNEEARERVAAARRCFEDFINEANGIANSIEQAVAFVDMVQQRLDECESATEIAFDAPGGMGHNSEISAANERIKETLTNVRTTLDSARTIAEPILTTAQGNVDELGNVIALFNR